MMTERIIIAGAGGQGIMLFGKVLALAALEAGKHTTWLPAYGAEVRGGTASCMVIISDEEIGSPLINKADTLIIMNNPSFEKFKDRVKNTGLVIMNSSLVEGTFDGRARALRYPFTERAVKLGNVKVANMVALGSYLPQKKLLSLETVMRVIEEMAPQNRRDLVEVNQKALQEGMRFCDGKS